MGLDILAQDGILGIFPEGGTWNPAQMQAQLGVAWLSYKAQAPVLPVGFGGIRNALRDILRFKHPKLIMNVGEIRQPVQLIDSTLSMKENLQMSANRIMEDINALIPEADLASFQKRVDEKYDLEIDIFPPTDILSGKQPPRSTTLAPVLAFLYWQTGLIAISYPDFCAHSPSRHNSLSDSFTAKPSSMPKR
jgi:hypothetical protein